MEENESWEYEIKCRRCGVITSMWHSPCDRTPKKDFMYWVHEKSTSPIHKSCDCNNGMEMLHDLVSYGRAMNLILKD